jgi:two-component system nitrate/nitrite sensor histidine kinase NarX
VLFILQEALSNVRKHAQASEVTVKVDNNRDFAMTVHDDGSGFDMTTVAQKGDGHVGLRIMHERAERLAAQFSITSSNEQGTTIALHLKREERLVA